MTAVSTDPERLAGLADRCEAAGGPDRELDRAIALTALSWRVEVDDTVYVNGPPVDYWYDPAGYCQGYQPPSSTASLDAAMSLVPEGCFARIYGDGAQGIIVRPFSGSYLEVGRGFAATPALALCAAALRARAHQEARP